MGQIMNSVCLCLCVCLSVCTLMVVFLDRFSPKVGTEEQPPKVRTSSLNGQPRTIPFPIPPKKTAVFGQKVLKIYAHINMPISALNVHESPKFSRHIGNWSRETRWGDVRFQTGSRNKAVRNRPYNLNLWPDRRNSCVLSLYDGDSAIGQIPCSTERVSSF